MNTIQQLDSQNYINFQIPVNYQDENKVIFYKEVEGTMIIIGFDYDSKIFSAMFVKEGRDYVPKECEFKATSWNTLKHKILIELRIASFQVFVGVSKKKRVQKAVNEIGEYFRDFP
jgi:hypothetical protein